MSINNFNQATIITSHLSQYNYSTCVKIYMYVVLGRNKVKCVFCFQIHQPQQSETFVEDAISCVLYLSDIDSLFCSCCQC